MHYQMLRGKLVSIRHRFAAEDGDTVIADVLVSGSQVAVKGKEDQDEPLAMRRDFTFFGGWSNYRNRGGVQERQFAFFSYTELEQDAEQIRSVLEFLGCRGFYKTTAKQVVRDFGCAAIRRLRQNPYWLLRYRGCGFKRVDALYCELGLPLNRTKRQLLCGCKALEDSTNGSTWVPMSVLDRAIRSSIDGAEPNAKRALRLGVRAGLLAAQMTDGASGHVEWDGSFTWVATEQEAAAERCLAEAIAAAMDERVGWPLLVPGRLSPHQFEQLQSALPGNVGLLLGGGGVGKTFAVAQLIRCLLSSGYKQESIALCAPTGKAAVRMTEQILEAGISGTRARTYHSLLGWSDGGFTHNQRCPLPHRVIIGDETSMVDTRLMNSLFQARPAGCPVLLVGDPYQLPPVGIGAPFRDLMQVVPYGELTEIRRNSGTIAAAGQDVRRGVEFRHDPALIPDQGKNLVIVAAHTPDVQLQELLRAIKDAESRGYEPMKDVQVIGIVNRNSDVSVSGVNQVLQDVLNRDSPKVQGSRFRVGDRVINTQNGWLTRRGFVHEDATVNASGGVYVANGEQGRVTEIAAKYMVVRIDTPERNVMVPRRSIEDESEEGQTGCDFQLAYCITAHKSQGSQWPVIICLIDEYYGARRIADRSMYYTMITRAKNYCVMIGKEDTVQAACRRASIDRRKTFLKELLGWKPQRTKLSSVLSSS